jgi:hypothetical protein
MLYSLQLVIQSHPGGNYCLPVIDGYYGYGLNAAYATDLAMSVETIQLVW